MRPTLIHVLEETEPEGAKRLECFRLTTLGVESRQDTTECWIGTGGGGASRTGTGC